MNCLASLKLQMPQFASSMSRNPKRKISTAPMAKCKKSRSSRGRNSRDSRRTAFTLRPHPAKPMRLRMCLS